MGDRRKRHVNPSSLTTAHLSQTLRPKTPGCFSLPTVDTRLMVRPPPLKQGVSDPPSSSS